MTTESGAQNRRRSQRVLLQVPVLIRAYLPEGTPIQSQAFTQVVNAHGGLIGASFQMTEGQRIRLISPHSKKEAGCRVVWVGTVKEGSFPTGFEFDEPNAQFWGISFPPTDWSLTQEVADED
jgi:hypothetical protein